VKSYWQLMVSINNMFNCCIFIYLQLIVLWFTEQCLLFLRYLTLANNSFTIVFRDWLQTKPHVSEVAFLWTTICTVFTQLFTLCLVFSSSLVQLSFFYSFYAVSLQFLGCFYVILSQAENCRVMVIVSYMYSSVYSVQRLSLDLSALWMTVDCLEVVVICVLCYFFGQEIFFPVCTKVVWILPL